MLRADPTSIGIESDPGRAQELRRAGSNVTTDLRAACRADIIFVCLPTPCGERGDVDPSAIHDCVARLQQLPLREGAVVVVRSTLPPRAVPASGRAPVLVNPEFLRARLADEDFRHPPFVLVGARDSDTEAAERVFTWYDGVGHFPVKRRVSIETALLTKYSFNWWRCVKVEFGNLLGDAATQWDASIDEVMSLFATDEALNLSMAYLTPGRPFGGECLPKDLLAGVRELCEPTTPLLLAVFQANRARGGKDPRRQRPPLTSIADTGT